MSSSPMNSSTLRWSPGRLGFHPVLHGVGKEVQSRIPGRKSTDHLGDLMFELWQVLLDDLPNDFLIYPKIVVNEAVACSGHIAPGNRRILIAEFIGQAFRCFTKYFQISDNCILCLVISKIIIPSHAIRVFQGTVNRILYIMKKIKIAFALDINQ
jgi:hypothetical protein